MLAPWKKSYEKPNYEKQHIEKQRYHFADKGLYNKTHGFSNSHVQMWKLDYKERLSTEELMFLNCAVGEDSWESLGLQGDQTINPKGNQPWIFIGRTDAEAEIPVLGLPDEKS